MERSGVQRSYSATQLITADDCAYQHYLRDIVKVRVKAQAANLIFGSCIDTSIREYLTALALGNSPPDPKARFLESWRAAQSQEAVRYASTQDPESFERMGCDLMQELPTAWHRTGFQVALDASGAPLIDRLLRATIVRGGRQVRIVGKLDLAVYTSTIRLAIIDVKASATVHSVLHTLRSDQLTMYQLLLEAHGESLGLPDLAHLGFWDLVKRKGTSHCADPVLVPARIQQELDAYLDKILWRAEDDERQRWPKVSRHLHNSPCELCDFATYCTEGDREGLIFPDPPER